MTQRTARRRSVRAALVVLLLAGFIGSAEGHDFWISPDPIEPRPGQAVLLRLFAGEWFAGDEVPYQAAHAVDFQHVAGGRTETLSGREGYSPAAFLREVAPGVHLVAYTSAGTDIQIEADKFNRHLQDSSLGAILAARRRDGQDRLPGRERFFRYAKVLIVTPGAKPDANTAGRVLGQKLEIVPEFDPVEVARKRASVRVQVLFEGKPLAGASVFAMPENDPQSGLIEAITDAKGRTAFALDRPGTWMVKLVWVVPGNQGADWESGWGSLVFQAG
jgi:hypothetical protein